MIEVNGLSNIIMEITIKERFGEPVDLEYIKKEAYKTIEYLRKWEQDRSVKWYDIINKGSVTNG